MSNNREKGKRIERWFANKLKHIFPDIRRNAGTQSQSGGVDLENTNPFNFEVKGGKAYKIKKVTNMLEQVKSEGKVSNWDVVLVKPDREKPYVIMYFDDFEEILENMHVEGIF